MAALRACLVLPLACSIVCSNGSDDFLGKPHHGKEVLVDHLENVLGLGSISVRAEKLQAFISPMFLSLPKRQGNLVSHASARYILHRVNVDQHGWSINGMTSSNDTFAIADIVGNLFPKDIIAIFDHHVMVDGLSLNDVTLLASTLEYFVRADMETRLRDVFQTLELPTDGPIPEVEMRDAVKAYMAHFLEFIDDEELQNLKSYGQEFWAEKYTLSPSLADTLMLVDDEIDTFFEHSEMCLRNPFHYRESGLDVASRLVARLADRYPKQAERECREVKGDLLEYEHKDTGRVRLVDFYRAGMGSRFFFVESSNYLSALGALDHTDFFSGPKVIVPNYVQAQTNCLVHSPMYALCCMNECEGLQAHLEREIAAPESTPQQILPLVSALSSSTVQGPRNLSAGLIARLDEIATTQGGGVILHSRLFAQWMHHAFPRECPYPHLSGTTTSLGPDAWEAKTGESVFFYDTEVYEVKDALSARVEELDKEISAKFEPGNATISNVNGDTDTQLMWSSDDEHFVEAGGKSLMFRGFGCFIIPFIVAVFAATTFMQHSAQLSENGKGTKCAMTV